MLNSLIDLAIDKRRSTFFIIFLLFIFGINAYNKIAKESNPEIKIPFITASVSYPGVAPEDSERMILKPLERQLKMISGVKRVTCEALLGRASCTAEFNAGMNSDRAINDVRDKVNIAKAEFPSEAEEPVVKEFDLNAEQPVIGIQLKGDISDDILFKIADELKEKISRLKEVLEVNVYGQRDHSVEILVKPEVINQYNIDLNDLSKVEANNKLVIGGTVRNGEGEFVFKVPGLILNLKDLLEMPIKSAGNTVVRFSDVAEVKKTYKDPSSISRMNGEKTVSVRVSKRSGENIIYTVQKVRAIVENYAAILPKNLEIIYTNDASDEIKESLTNLTNNLLLSVIIVFFVVLNMIGMREGIFIMTAVPLTFLMGILFLYVFGYTMNIVVLFALVLGTGMIVDASIVIIEYSEILIKDGVPHTEAYRRAAKKMLIPIFSSIFTTLLVALPLLFWPGIPGKFMRYLPLTLIALLSSSFIVAIFFLPVIGTKFGKSHVKQKKRKGEVDLSMSGLIATPTEVLLEIKGKLGFYIRWVWYFLSNPKKSVGILAGILIAILVLYIAFNKGMEFFPNTESSNAVVRIKARGNLSLEEKDKLVKMMEDRLQGLEKDIKYYQALTLTSSGDTIGRINLEFTYWRFRRKVYVIMEDIKKRMADIPGVEINVDVSRGGPGASKAIMLNILSDDSEKIEETIEKIREYMEADGGFTNIEDKLPLNKIEYSLKIDRAEAAKYGVDIGVIGSFIRLATDGLIISNYRPSYSYDKVDIVLRFPINYRSIEDIRNIKVPSNKGVFVPISSFSKLEMQKETPRIRRLNQKRVVEFSADVKKGFTPSVKIAQLFNWLSESRTELSAQVEMAGDAEDQAETGAFLMTAFASALLIIFLLFLMQFNSVGKTVIVMTSIFLSIFGVLLGLLLSGQAFSVVMCGIAIVALAGIVVDSSILFVETFNDLRKMLPLKEALLKSAILRVKPILLTSVTTVSSLIPMIFGMSLNFLEQDITIGSPASQFWVQLSASISGGLTFSTVLTLFFMPVIILLEENFKQKLNNGSGFSVYKKVKSFFLRKKNFAGGN
jgi:multidrug efflux pump